MWTSLRVKTNDHVASTPIESENGGKMKSGLYIQAAVNRHGDG